MQLEILLNEGQNLEANAGYMQNKYIPKPTWATIYWCDITIYRGSGNTEMRCHAKLTRTNGNHFARPRKIIVTIHMRSALFILDGWSHFLFRPKGMFCASKGIRTSFLLILMPPECLHCFFFFFFFLGNSSTFTLYFVGVLSAVIIQIDVR